MLMSPTSPTDDKEPSEEEHGANDASPFISLHLPMCMQEEEHGANDACVGFRNRLEKYISDFDISGDEIQTPKVILVIGGDAVGPVVPLDLGFGHDRARSHTWRAVLDALSARRAPTRGPALAPASWCHLLLRVARDHLASTEP